MSADDLLAFLKGMFEQLTPQTLVKSSQRRREAVVDWRGHRWRVVFALTDDNNV